VDLERVDRMHDSESERSSSGRWIRDQLREVADTNLAELERSAVQRGSKAEADDDEEQSALENLAASISSAVVEPMRNLERSRAAHQHQMEASLTKLSASLEEMQRRFGSVDQQLEAARARSQALANELRPGIAAVETQLKGLDESFRRDLAALGAGLEQVREQIGPLAIRLTASEESTARHAAALDAVTQLERRRQEASRQIAHSVDGLRDSLSRLTGLELSPSPEDADPPAPEFAADDEG